MSNIRYSEEVITTELFDELMPLLETHRQELSAFQDFKLNPSIDHYITLNRAGIARIYIGRDESDVIVGYVCYVISHNMHYQDFLYAYQDVLYVVPERRGARIAVDLLAFAEAQLLPLGVNVINQHVKVKKDFGVLLEKQGYKFVEKIYMKRIQ